MRQLDETDLEILRLLIADARRPFNEIADHVGLSPPAVSDRIQRMEELGVIQGFTVRLDRTKLENNVPVIIELTPAPSAVEAVHEAVAALDAVEHVYRLYDGRILTHANAPVRDVHDWLRDVLDFEDIAGYDIHLVSDHEWQVGVGPADFAVACVVCGNTVGGDGEIARIDGEIKPFCCPSCEEQYVAEHRARTEEAT